MAKARNDGVTVQCVGCKKKEVIPFARAAELDDPPVCQYCLLPMVALSAKVTRP